MAVIATNVFCKMIRSKKIVGTESCSFIGFVEKKLFKIKVSRGQTPALAGIGLIFK